MKLAKCKFNKRVQHLGAVVGMNGLRRGLEGSYTVVC